MTCYIYLKFRTAADMTESAGKIFDTA